MTSSPEHEWRKFSVTTECILETRQTMTQILYTDENVRSCCTKYELCISPQLLFAWAQLAPEFRTTATLVTCAPSLFLSVAPRSTFVGPISAACCLTCSFTSHCSRQVKYSRSRSLTEVKQHWARSALGWVTPRKSLVGIRFRGHVLEYMVAALCGFDSR